MLNIVSFNGGRGAKNLIPSFLNMDGINLTSIVNAYDDGKSTGEIRSFFKMLGPSDIRKVQEAMIPENLADHHSILQMFEYRFSQDAQHDKVLAELTLFANGNTETLAGIAVTDKGMLLSLKTCIQKLVQGINLIEKAEHKQLNFADCSLMNLVYAGAYLHFGGNFEEATVFIDKLFKLKGTVLPTNNEDKKMVALREDGTILYSEAEIVELRANSRIKKIYLLDSYPERSILSKMSLTDVEAYFEIMNRQVCVTSKVKRSISDADIIIYSAGTQHSSLYPSYMTKGLTDAIAANKKALKVFIANIGEDYETPSYTASDLINGAIKYLRSGAVWNVEVNELIDFALINNQFSDKKLENYIQYDIDDLETIGCNIIVDAFEDSANSGKHNGPMLSKYILDLYEKQATL